MDIMVIHQILMYKDSWVNINIWWNYIIRITNLK